jgi:hypothetical protein
VFIPFIDAALGAAAAPLELSNLMSSGFKAGFAGLEPVVVSI